MPRTARRDVVLPAVPYPARWEREAAKVYRQSMREITAGILAALSEDPEAEWDSLDTHEPCPGDEVIAIYRARYDAFVATLG